MRTVFLLASWVACMAPGGLHAQQEPAPALSAAAARSRVDSLNDLSFYTDDPAAARQYAESALETAVRAGYPKGVGDGYLRLGQAAFAVGRLDEARDYYRKSLAEREKLGNRPDISSCFNELAKAYQARGLYDSAAVFFQRGLSVLEGQPPHINGITLNSNLGHLYRLSGQYSLAKKHLETAMALLPRLLENPPSDYTPAELERTRASVRLDLAEFLQSALHQYPAAKDSLLKSLETFEAQGEKALVAKCLLLLGNNAYFSNDLAAAKDYYDRGIALGNAAQKTDHYTLIRNRGRIYLDQREYQKALSDFRTSLAAFQGPDDTPHAAATLAEIGNLYYELSRPDSAIHYYRRALDQNIQDPILKGRLYYFLSDILYQAGRVDESEKYAGDYIRFLESLQAGQTAGAFAALNWQFLDKNRLLRSIARQEKQTQRTYGLFALGGLALLVLLALLAARLQRQKRRLADQNAQLARQEAEKARQDAEIARQDAEIARQDVEIARQDAEIARQDVEIARQREQLAVQENLELLKAREVETTYARLHAQDEMQQKIGRELHDNIGAMLTTARLRLAPVDEVLDVLPDNTRQNFQTANQLLQQACEELRQISRQLSSATLMQFGLAPQLQALADHTPLEVHLELFGLEKRLDFNIELNIYRIIQELVQNIVKHARARQVTIAVNRFEDRVNILVEDDGQGFDPEQVRNKPGMGLRNLAARLNELNGQMAIDSAPGRGTNVIIDIYLGDSRPLLL